MIFSNTDKDELDAAIRKYRLDNLLLLIADQTRQMFAQGDSLGNIDWQRRIGNYIQKVAQPMPAWRLAELSYRAICNSNDHRSIDPTMQDVFSLNNLLSKTGDDKARLHSTGTANKSTTITILLGISQEQFWWQDIARNRLGIVYNFLRYYLLLYKIPPTFSQFRLPDEDLKELTGFNIHEFSMLLFLLYAWVVTTSTSEISLFNNIDEQITAKNPTLNLENVRKVMGYFTQGYDYYRGSHPNNPLFFRPIVRTQKNRLIVSNAFILIKKFYEGIYWLVRDKYRALGSQAFTNAFGYYYEKYIQDILEFYLTLGSFRRISEQGKADWIIESEKYVLIVEQKSSLMSIELKKEYPSMEKLEDYFSYFVKASKQLRNTDQDFKSQPKETIKIILHFESLFFKESFIKREIIKLEGGKKEDFSGYYLVDTEEFEQLIQLLSDDPDGFNEIIETKRGYEVNPPPIAQGLEFSNIIRDKDKWGKVRFLETSRHIFDDLVAL